MSRSLNQLSSMVRAKEQWEHVDRWLTTQLEALSNETGSQMWRIILWLLAAFWRLAIVLGAITSGIIELIILLLVPAFDWLDAILGWVLLPVAAPLELVLSLPYVGRLLGWLLRGLLTVLWAVLHLPELPLVMLGIMPPKRLRLWVLPTGNLAEGNDGLDSWLQAVWIAGRILQSEANVKLTAIVPAPQVKDFKGEDRSIRLFEWIQDLPALTLDHQLEVSCEISALKEDMGPRGGIFERWALLGHPRGAFRRLSGWGAPIMAIGVHSVAAGTLAGCSLGPLTDYITVRQDQPICLAHEIGHACNLPHRRTPGNLMDPNCGGLHLSRWQVLLLRLSRHVSFF